MFCLILQKDEEIISAMKFTWTRLKVSGRNSIFHFEISNYDFRMEVGVLQTTLSVPTYSIKCSFIFTEYLCLYLQMRDYYFLDNLCSNHSEW